MNDVSIISLILFFRLQFTVTLWNPTIHPVVHHVRVPVRNDYTVRDPTGNPILAEVLFDARESK